MIQVNQVIDYLRSRLQTKNNNIRVDGAAELANAKDDSRLMVEAGKSSITTTLFVTLGPFVATTISYETFEETYDERLVIIACLDNQKDRTGKSAQQEVFFLRKILFKLLLNYGGFDVDADGEDNSHTLQYVGDQMLEMDRARYWHKFEYKLMGRLLPEDGVDMDLTNLNEILSNYFSNDPLADEPIATDDLKGLYDIPAPT